MNARVEVTALTLVPVIVLGDVPEVRPFVVVGATFVDVNGGR